MTCIACGGTLVRHERRRKGYARVRCRACGLARIDPVPDAATLADYYSHAYALAADAARVDVDAYRRQGAAVARLFERRAPGARRVCEIGCAGGWLLAELQRRGYRVKGYELSATTARLAREQQGVDVVTGEFPAEGEPFEIILMRHVIEHTRDPLREIAAAAARLVPGGTLFLATPNGAGLSSRVLGQHWSWYIPPAHIWYFTAAALRRLTARAGLRPVWHRTTQGDANNPAVELAVGAARWVRARTRGATGPRRNAERETLTAIGNHRAGFAAANSVLAPLGTAVGAVGLGDELWVAARREPAGGSR